MSVIIRKAVPSDFDQLVKFNQKAFPNRKFTQEFIQYRLEKDESQQPRAVFYVAEIEGEIVAQRVMLREDWLLNGKKYEAYWGTDFFVNPQFQGRGIGKKIIHEIQRDLPILSTTNTGAINLKMHKNLNYNHAGQLNLYFKPLRMIPVARAVLNRVLNIKKKSVSKLKVFSFPNLLNEFELKSYVQYNRDMVKFEHIPNLMMGQRDEAYMKWRYFYQDGAYQFYQNVNGSNYFIGRSIVWKGMNCLMIVDLRYDAQDVSVIKNSLKAINALGKKMNFDGILMSSSLVSMQRQLKNNKFFNYSKNQITTNFPIEKDIEIMVHFSDSDLDFNYSNSPFVYGKSN